MRDLADIVKDLTTIEKEINGCKASLGNAEEPDERQKEFLDSIGVAITHPEDTDQIENV
jgi:hypothetical protein